MTNTQRSDPRIESYLARVSAALRGIPEREMDDILRELRSHAGELAEGQGVEAALRSLGDPVELARTYRAENEMARAECSNNPLVILQGLRNASRSRWRRFPPLVLYLFGYANVVSLWAAALDKLLAPSRTGRWYAPGNFWPLQYVADGRPPVGARELLGWWIVPIALIAGFVLRYLVDHAAQWWIRRSRRSKEFRQS